MKTVSFFFWALCIWNVAQAQPLTAEYVLPDVEAVRLPSLFPSLPVYEGQIREGKKVTTSEPAELPSLPNNNYRQALAEVPGLLVSEVNNESWASLTFRGLGDPHESFNLLVLRDGLPVAPDLYGYPAAYYAPAHAALEGIDFYRGGSALLFGPQPAGALNYRLRRAKDPRTSAATGLHGQVLAQGGSFGQYNFFGEALGQLGQDLSGLLSFHSRGQQGFREANNQTSIVNPRMNFRVALSGQQEVQVDLDHYRGVFDEPGGLARLPGAGLLSLDEPRQVTLRHDELQIDRDAVVLRWLKDWSERSQSVLELWTNEMRRESFRQNLGGAPSFGGVPLASTNTIQLQNFWGRGFDFRQQLNHKAFSVQQVATMTVQGRQIESIFRQSQGATVHARSGVLQRDLDRKTGVLAVAAENAFRFSRFSLTPGVRFEEIHQSVGEKLNTLSSDPLRQTANNQKVWLGGIGFEAPVTDSSAVYANFSQGYKPPSFQDTVPLLVSDTISEDLGEAKVFSSEIGIRGSNEVAEFDVSVFNIDYSNIFGRVGTNFQNIGRSRHQGIDGLVGFFISPRLRGFASYSFLDAQFVSGSQTGKTPQYAPEHIVRAGLTFIYNLKTRFRLQGQYVSGHFGDDGNSPNFRLGERTVFDLAAEHRLPIDVMNGQAQMIWGVQNIFDQAEPSRVRSNGYEPALPTSFYGGLRLEI